jgi:hypothetical protein
VEAVCVVTSRSTFSLPVLSVEQGIWYLYQIRYERFAQVLVAQIALQSRHTFRDGQVTLHRLPAD